MIKLDKRNVSWSTIDSTLCLFSFTERRFIQLNHTAQFVFERIIANDGIADLNDLETLLTSTYPSISQHQIKEDIACFIKWLPDKKVLIRG